MVECQREFADLMRRVQAGRDDAAARELLERYEADILRVVRRRLAPKLRSKFDSTDFVQAVWASFFANPPPAQALDRPEALGAYLQKLAQHKVIDAVRQRLQAQKYNVNRENSLDGSAAYQAAGLTAQQPTPSQVAMAREEWDRLLEGQPARYRQILLLRRQGHSHREIAHKLGLDETTIRRAIRNLAPRLVP